MVLFLIRIKELGQAKVCDLDMLWGLHQDISCCQVTVNQVTVLKIVHSLQLTDKSRRDRVQPQVNVSLRGPALSIIRNPLGRGTDDAQRQEDFLTGLLPIYT